MQIQPLIIPLKDCSFEMEQNSSKKRFAKHSACYFGEEEEGRNCKPGKLASTLRSQWKGKLLV